MSYDICWHYRKETVDDSRKCYDENGNTIAGTYENSDLNITFNLVRMFSWAFGVKYWVDEVHGKKGSEIIKPLANAITKMLLHRKEAEQYNSPNGWGTYPHALKFLEDLLFECQEHPNMYLEICR